MIRIVAVLLLLLLGPAIAGAAEPVAATAPAFMKYAWIWSGKDAAAPGRRYVPVAACTMDCCCEFFQGGERKSQCKSHDDCLNAGGICRSKSDAKCN